MMKLVAQFCLPKQTTPLAQATQRRPPKPDYTRNRPPPPKSIPREILNPSRNSPRLPLRTTIFQVQAEGSGIAGIRLDPA